MAAFFVMEKYYTYILYSEKLDRYYIGSTSDVDTRLIRHNAGGTKSTKSGRPWVLVYKEVFNTRAEAYNRELYIKQKKSRVFIEELIRALE